MQTNPGNSNWQSWASIASGAKLTSVAGEDNYGYIHTSTDSGVTWIPRIGAGSHNWSSITSSSDGSKLAAVAYGGSIYTSTDSGATWTEQTSAGSRDWRTITSSSDGSKLSAVASNSSIYTSTDSGTTWTEQTSTGPLNWYSITSSSDGSKLAAVAYGGLIYTGFNADYAPQPTTTTFPNATDSKDITLTTPVGTSLSCNNAVSESALVTQDESNSYPLGLVDFCLTVPSGSTQDITLAFETDFKPSDVVARKYNRITKQYADVQGATVTEDTVGGKHVLVLKYQVTDGGELDEDGVANGEIIDPVGLAIVAGDNSTAGSSSSSSSTSSLLSNSLLASTGQNKLYFVAVALLAIASGTSYIKKFAYREK